MIGGINPKQMQGMMKKMGISQTEIPSKRVIIEKTNGEQVIIENPQILKIKMQGQISYQISGEEYTQTEKLKDSTEDIKMIIEKTGATEEEAKAALEKTGDLTEAIMELS